MLRAKYLIPVTGFFLLGSCGVIEKSSMHGFDSGYYKLKADNQINKVYVDVEDEKVDAYPLVGNQLSNRVLLAIPSMVPDSIISTPIWFSKKSLDLDITSVLLKYRPATNGVPGQMTTDFNVALYAGWRHDFYRLQIKTNPMGKRHYAIVNRGYDFGIFAGPGSTYIDANTIRDPINYEYNGIIIQFGVAGFLETSFASFGISTGFDCLLSPDRPSWIYNKKPWVGFIIGIALN